MPRASRTSPRHSAAAPAAVEVLVKDKGWGEALPGAGPLAEAVIAAALADPAVREKAPPASVSVGLCLAGDEDVRALNRAFRGQDAATNVLAFPSQEAGFLGDIILARGVVLAEARAQGKTPSAHATHLLLHGFLHLIGFDHGSDPEAAAMERVEARILKGLGIADPYRGEAAK